MYLFLFQEEVMTGASIPDWCFCGHFLDTIKHQHYYYSGISWSGNFEIAQVIMIFLQKSGNVMMKGHWSYNYSSILYYCCHYWYIHTCCTLLAVKHTYVHILSFGYYHFNFKLLGEKKRRNWKENFYDYYLYKFCVESI